METFYKIRALKEILVHAPETLNKHTIEVIEEDGQKIGTISFGEISLKIIANSNIEFKNKSQEEKVKRK